MSHSPSPLEVARARAKDAGCEGDWPQAVRWAERAWRLSGRRPLAALEFAAALLNDGDAKASGFGASDTGAGDARAEELLAEAAEHHPDFPVLIALAAAQRRTGARLAAQATLQRLLTTVAVDAVPPLAALADEVVTWAGLDGWLGWRGGRLLFGAARGSPETAALTLDRRRIALDWVAEAPRLWSAALPPDSAGTLRAAASLLGAPLRPGLFLQPEGSIAQQAGRLRGWVHFPRDPGRQPGLTIALARHGRPTAPAVPELILRSADETAPFARRWGFDLPLPPGSTVTGLTETSSGRTIPVRDLEYAGGGPPPVGPGRSRRAGPPRVTAAQERILLVTHDEGGGIERHVQHRLAALRRAGKAGLLLRSQRDRPGAVKLGSSVFQLPADAAALLDRLREVGPTRLEYHQPRRHDDLVWGIAAALGVPHDVYLHDYALLCPRATLVGADGTYCGEPPVATCRRCLSSFPQRDVFAPAGVAALRRRSADLLSRAALVRAPSADIARRFRRHVPGVTITTRPWETTRPNPRRTGPAPEHAHVCVVGALNEHKGFRVLLDCARDAAVQGLPIRFTVVGHTIDDAALIGAGAFVTGPYQDAERDGLIARQRATVGFMPSIWPEPWCYSLTGLLDAGLPTVCFDIGAQAERVRAAGGSVLPLGIPAPEINCHILDRHRHAAGAPALIVTSTKST